jgi:hypothetical protein
MTPSVPDEQLLSPFPWRASRRLLERLLLVGLLVGLLALKFKYFAGEPEFDPDGSYYYDIAAHVRDGDGLVTDVSLFNAGFTHFPHASAIYPLWPLVLGLVGRVVPLDLAAVWLPTLFYFAAIVLAYRLARRVAPDPLFPETWPVLHAGHLAAAVLALTTPMFFMTSRPFTEGMGYFLLLVALTRAERFFRAPGVWRGGELGVWLGLVILTRSQLVLVAFAVALALAWAVLRLGWRRWLAPALACMAGLAAVLGVQLAHIASFADAPRLAYLLRFDLVRDPSELAPLEVMVRPPGCSRGSPTAPAGSRSRSAGASCRTSAASGCGARRCWPRCRSSRSTPGARCSGAARGCGRGCTTRPTCSSWRTRCWRSAGCCRCTRSTRRCSPRGTSARGTDSPPGLRSSRRSSTWRGRPVLGRVVALFLVTASVYFGFWRISTSSEMQRKPGEGPGEWSVAHNQAITAWLHERSAAEPGLVVVAPDIEVQKLARFTDGVGYHWIYRTTTWDELDFLFRERGARYLLLRDEHAHRLRRLARDKRFSHHFTREAVDLSGFSVFRPRRLIDPPGTWPARPPAVKTGEDDDD